jgi:hypothetical protein
MQHSVDVRGGKGWVYLTTRQRAVSYSSGLAVMRVVRAKASKASLLPGSISSALHV